LEPYTAVYDFLIKGALNYKHLQKPTLWSQNHQTNRLDMGDELIPKSLGITESSQHANILELRKTNNHTRQTNDSLYSKVILKYKLLSVNIYILLHQKFRFI